MSFSVAEQTKTQLKKTPLHETHLRMGARMVEFGGWMMPVQYSGILEEHRAVRQRAGLFDISHMGEIEVRGGGALDFSQGLITGDLSKSEIGRAQYNLLLKESGGTLDDLIVYHRGEDQYFIVVNAANTEKDFSWISSHAPSGLQLEDLSLEMGLLALQGPRAEAILQPLVEFPLSEIGYYWAREGMVAGHQAYIARTGYTGEDGFELFVPWDVTPGLWDILLEAGQSQGLLPCGLGARDTLRLEACFPLYGHELDETITPLEAGLAKFVSLEKEEFIGRQALLQQKEKGLQRRLMGLKMQDPGIPRQGYTILRDDQEVGFVTSGTHSPTLGYAVALGFVAAESAQLDSTFEVLIHGQPRRAVSVPRPFYKRSPQK